MFNLKFVPLQPNFSAKLIIYDENTAHHYVNNCYFHGIFTCESALHKERTFLFAAHTRL